MLTDIIPSNPKRLQLDERVTIDPDGNLYFSYLIPDDNQGGYFYKCNNLNTMLDISVVGSRSTVSVERYGYNPDRRPVIRYPQPDETKRIALLGETLEFKCIFR